MNLNDLKVQAIWAADTQSGRDAAVDVSAVDITLDNPLRVKDALTIDNHTGTKLMKVADLLANDSEWQGDLLQITKIRDLKGGTIVGGYNSTTGEWTSTLTANGEIQFTPAPAYTGVISFKYKIADADGTPSAVAFIARTTPEAEMRGQVFIKTPDMPTDALFTDLWYSNDINVQPVWAEIGRVGISQCWRGDAPQITKISDLSKPSPFRSSWSPERRLNMKIHFKRAALILIVQFALMFPGPTTAGERIPPYAAEASALLHQIRSQVPELRTSKFDQMHQNRESRKLSPDAILFSAGGMVCHLEKSEEYCISFEIDADAQRRPDVIDKIKKILTDPCNEIHYSVKNFDKNDSGYWGRHMSHEIEVDQVKRIKEFFNCSKPKRRHYVIVINIVRNLDHWMTPSYPFGPQRHKVLLENLIEQLVVSVY